MLCNRLLTAKCSLHSFAGFNLFLRFVVCARRSIIPTRLDLTLLRITVNHFYLTASYKMYNWKENTLRIAAKKHTHTQKQYKENHIWTEQRLTSLRDEKFLNEDTRWMEKNIFRNSSCCRTASGLFCSPCLLLPFSTTIRCYKFQNWGQESRRENFDASRSKVKDIFCSMIDWNLFMC